MPPFKWQKYLEAATYSLPRVNKERVALFGLILLTIVWLKNG